MSNKGRVEGYLELAHEAEKLAAASRNAEEMAHWTRIAIGYRQLAQASLDNSIIGETVPQPGRSPASEDEPST